MIIWYICSAKYIDMAKVIHVHLTHGIDGTKRRDWYFSSISAVYTVLTAQFENLGELVKNTIFVA